ncbi:hypothetical protein H7F33_09380 [Pedobacter sp. PAMC26386]|nr:hypothetical protein H7F33_09380 [Pedobacter sp. PAMC26386]
MVLQSGTVLWVFDYDFPNFSLLDKIGILFSGVNPLHTNAGMIYLKHDQISLASADEELIIPLKNITQVYLGFDNIYKATYVKSGGTFWQPLRLIYTQDNEPDPQTIYLVIDLNYLASSNATWFEVLKNMLS